MFQALIRPHGPGYGSRSRIGLIGHDFKDLGACLRRYTTGYVSTISPLGKDTV